MGPKRPGCNVLHVHVHYDLRQANCYTPGLGDSRHLMMLPGLRSAQVPNVPLVALPTLLDQWTN